jgi:hypothetical protein
MLLVTASMTAPGWAQGSGNAPLAELGSSDGNSDSPFLVTRTVAGKILWIKKDRDETLIVVEDSQGRRGVLTVNQKTRFRADKKTEYSSKHISAEDLEVGLMVKVTFVPKNGRVVQVRFEAKTSAAGGAL